MPRKTIDVTIPDGYRDSGKTFRVVEMPSLQVERWAMRAVGALIRCGAEVPDDLAGAGMAAIVAIGIRSLSQIPPDELESLMAEMFTCVQFVPGPSIPARALVDGLGDGDDIEDLRTRFLLRQKIVELHTDFS